MTVNELAKTLKISKAGVYRLVDKRLIPFYKVMRGLRFDSDEIASYLKHNRIDAIGNNNDYGNTEN